MSVRATQLAEDMVDLLENVEFFDAGAALSLVIGSFMAAWGTGDEDARKGIEAIAEDAKDVALRLRHPSQ